MTDTPSAPQNGGTVIGEHGLAPVSVVDGIGYANSGNGEFILTLVSLGWTPLLDGKGAAPDPRVCARLRFNTAMAVQLRDVLDKMLLNNAPVQETVN